MTRLYLFFGDTPAQRELNFAHAVAALALILAGTGHDLISWSF